MPHRLLYMAPRMCKNKQFGKSAAWMCLLPNLEINWVDNTSTYELMTILTTLISQQKFDAKLNLHPQMKCNGIYREYTVFGSVAHS